MKNFKTTAAPGLFDVEFRLQWLLAKGNSLSRLDAVIDWESFLPDEQAEYQINDRFSFQQFIGWTLADKVPDGNTLWDCRTRQRRLVGLGFREALIEAGAFEKLFAIFDEQLRERALSMCWAT